MATLKEQRDELLAEADGIVKAAQAAGRNLTKAEGARVPELLKAIDGIDAQINRRAQVRGAAGPTHRSRHRVRRGRGLWRELRLRPQGRPGAAQHASPYAKSAIAALAKQAGGYVKALLQGVVNTNPALTVAMPYVPHRLVDLVPRELIREEGNFYSYLRQVVRTNNAAPVADGALKPTSQFTSRRSPLGTASWRTCRRRSQCGTPTTTGR